GRSPAAGELRPSPAGRPDHGRGWDDPAVLRQDVLEEAAPDAVAIERVVGRRSEAVAHEPCRVSAELAVLEPDGRDAAASARDGQLERVDPGGPEVRPEGAPHPEPPPPAAD